MKTHFDLDVIVSEEEEFVSIGIIINDPEETVDYSALEDKIKKRFENLTIPTKIENGPRDGYF